MRFHEPRLQLISLAILLCFILLELIPTLACAVEPVMSAGAVSQDDSAMAILVGNSVIDAPLPDQHGMSLEYGYVYDPRPNRTFMLARAFAIYDYGTAWRKDNCPSTLRFKVEGAVGSTMTPTNDLIVSVNMLALKYPLGLEGSVRPYGEAGIGLIYTQFRVEGQGLNINFNPLLGVGLELAQKDGKNLFGAIRLHHISNGGLDHNNRGVNSVILQIGRFF